MIVKFHSRGRGRASGPIDYLLKENGKPRDKAKLISGNPERMATLIDSVPFKQKYTSGVLSFSESDLSTEKKEAIMQSFEKVLLPGLDHNNYSIMWVQHQDKERLELNFLVAGIELQTGKSLPVYYHRIDKNRIDAFKNIINNDYGLSDPNDPLRKRPFSLGSTNTPRAAKQIKKEVNDYLNNCVNDGLINNRNDLLRVLSDAKIEIGRETKNYISIKNPDGKRNIKLEGEIYERDFQAAKRSPESTARRASEYRKTSKARRAENTEKLKNLYERKHKYNRDRFKVSPDQNKAIVIEANHDLALGNGSDSIAYRVHSELLQLHTNRENKETERNIGDSGRQYNEPERAGNNSESSQLRGLGSVRSSGQGRRNIQNAISKPKRNINSNQRNTRTSLSTLVAEKLTLITRPIRDTYERQRQRVHSTVKNSLDGLRARLQNADQRTVFNDQTARRRSAKHDLKHQQFIHSQRAQRAHERSTKTEPVFQMY